MDMYAQRGSKVIFTGQGGRDSDKEFANKYLKVGEVYTVKTTKVFDWISFVVLEELPFKDFNTVMFEDLEDDDTFYYNEIDDVEVKCPECYNMCDIPEVYKRD